MDPVFGVEVLGDLARNRVGEVDRGPVVVEQVGGGRGLGVHGDRTRKCDQKRGMLIQLQQSGGNDTVSVVY